MLREGGVHGSRISFEGVTKISKIILPLGRIFLLVGLSKDWFTATIQQFVERLYIQKKSWRNAWRLEMDREIVALHVCIYLFTLTFG